MGMRYTICHWAINRSDPQNLLSVTLDIPLHNPSFCPMLPYKSLFSCASISKKINENKMKRNINIDLAVLPSHDMPYLLLVSHQN